MSQYPLTPVITAGPSDEQPAEQQYIPTLTPDIDTNWATDPATILLIQQQVMPIVKQVKSDRISLEEDWKAVRRMSLLTHDDGQRYIGRSNAYVPAWSRALTTLVSKVSRGLFPSDEYMDVTERADSTTPDRAKAVKQYLQYEFEKVAKVRANIKPFLREFFSFGVAVAKYWYEPRQLAKQKTTRMGVSSLLGEQPQYKDDFSREGLRFSPRSIFNWHIYPMTANSLDEATLIAEDIDVTRQFIDEMLRLKQWVNTDNVLNIPVDADHDNSARETLNDFTGNSRMKLEGNELGDIRTIQEVWTRIRLPKRAYAQDEDPECPVMCKIVYAGDTVFQVKRNPFWHNNWPYLVARMEVMTGSFYPKGVGHNARYLQYLVNDFTNQLNDNGTYALNPVAKVNPGMLAGPLPPLKPGAVWPMTNVKEGVEFDRPPIEQIQYGMQLVSSYMSMLQDFTGAPPVLQGNGAGKGAKTATGAQILQANASNPIQDLVEDIENDVMMPLMYGAWVLGQQYRSGTLMDEIGGAPIKIDREQLRGDFTMRWLASSQAVNQQQRAQQAISLLQVIESAVPLLQPLGYIVDPMPLLNRIYSDGFGFRNFDKFIFKAPVDPMTGQPNPQLGQAPQPPGSTPTSGQEDQPNQVGNVRSALDNAYGSGQQMVEGEGGEFANVRDEADGLAGLFGGK